MSFVAQRANRAEAMQGLAQHAAWRNSISRSGSFQLSSGYGMPMRSISSGVPSHYAPAPYITYTRPSIYRPPSVRVPRASSGNKIRTFTNKEGGTVEARLISINSTNKTAKIKTRKGLSYNVPISRFCESDISYLKGWWYKRNPPKKKS